MPDRMNCRSATEILKVFARSQDVDRINSITGDSMTFDGSNLVAPLFPNKYSRLELACDGDTAVISDMGKVLVTGKFARAGLEWGEELLSNGLPVRAIFPGMSSLIINILFTMSCDNYNTGRTCRYCGLFNNPVSKVTDSTPYETLVDLAGYMAEGLKIATDNGWRGTLAVSGGALHPSQQSEYLKRLEVVLSKLRGAVDAKTFSRLRVLYNHYPPHDFRDMETWKDMGINCTSFDMEVMDPAYFPAICPGKNAYKPHEYWKEAQIASTDVFGPIMGTATNIVMGVEPMKALVEGVEERLSRGVLPIPINLQPAPGSDYELFRPPTADWILEASDRIADAYLNHIPKFLNESSLQGKGSAENREGGNAPSSAGSIKLTSMYLNIVFDEVLRRLQG